MKKQHTAAFSIVRSDTEKKAPALAVRAFRAAALYAGFLALLQGFTGLWESCGWLMALAGLAAVVWQSIVLSGKQCWLRAALALCCLLAAAIFAKPVLAGAVSVYNAVCNTLTVATGQIYLPLAAQSGSAALFSGILAALLGVFCVWAVRQSPIGCGIGLSVLFAAELLVLQPQSAAGWMAAAPAAAVLLLAGGAADHHESAPSLLSYGSLLALAGVLAATLLSVPAVRSGELFSAWSGAGRAALHRLRYETGEAALPEGDFRSFTAAADETPCLRVTMQAPTQLYLRGFTADVFTGDTWQALDTQTLAGQSDLIYWLHKDGFYPQTQLASAARASGQPEQTQTVQIENTGACSAYLYVPYALQALPQSSAIGADSLETGMVPAGGARGVRQYQLSIPFSPEQTAAQALEQLSAQPETAVGYLSPEGSYRALVQEQSLSLSLETRVQLAPVLDQICSAYGAADSLTAEQAQVCTLRFLDELDTIRGAGISLPLDELAKDTSYQTATLAVLALRYYGIPARYAEGFVLTQEAAARSRAGSAITLTAADAQGWAEVYQDGVGWMPLALTPGYGELTDALSPHEAGASGQSSEEQTENGSISQAETLEEEAEETEDRPQEEPGGGAQSANDLRTRSRLWLLAVAGLLLLLLAAVIVRYTMIRRRWETRFSRTAPAQSVAWVAKALSLLWPAMKLGYDGGSIFAFSEALRETDAAYADAVRTIAALNAEARFSSHAMTREQAALARMIWQQSVARLKRERRPLRRFWLKWVRCMY